ncbi:MAG: phosphatase PAP2 family protein [Planctomycetes bacterium]|nr:phosphatase PAP2 family protein [Planctomycetota bacterium]
MNPVRSVAWNVSAGVLAGLFVIGSVGCVTLDGRRSVEPTPDAAVNHYVESARSELRARADLRTRARTERLVLNESLRPRGPASAGSTSAAATFQAVPTLGMYSEPSALGGSQPTTVPAVTLPASYWSEDIWHQMGDEFLSFTQRDFWRGFKTSFWDVENALALTATMVASISVRESGVDDAVRRRIRGHRRLGDFDEPLQILGNPGTHIAAAGLLWLGSTLAEDPKQHEVSKTLAQALAVNGVTTLALKTAANTRSPDGERYAWPSGHTSSAFTTAAVLNESYGPWVGVPSLALAGLVGYQRLDSRSHDFSDVVFGAVLGYVIGSSIARDNKAAFPEIFGMQLVPFADPQTGASGFVLMGSIR